MMRLTIVNDCHYNQALKSSRGGLVGTSAPYAQRLKRHRKDKNDPVFDISCQFSYEDFDGVHCLAYLGRDNLNLSISAPTFNLYRISGDGLWAKTFLDQKAGTLLADGSWACSFNQSEVVADIDGELTFYLEVESQRAGKALKARKYFNHIGSYDSIVQLRNKYTFLFLTKLDE